METPSRREENLFMKSPSSNCHSSPRIWVEYPLLSSCSELQHKPYPPRLRSPGSEVKPCPNATNEPNVAHSTLVKIFRNFLGSVLFSGASSSSYISGAGWAASRLFCPPSSLTGCLLDKVLSNSPCTTLTGGKCVQRPQDGASGQPALSYPSCGDRCLFLEFHFKATS